MSAAFTPRPCSTVAQVVASKLSGPSGCPSIAETPSIHAAMPPLKSVMQAASSAAASY